MFVIFECHIWHHVYAFCISFGWYFKPCLILYWRKYWSDMMTLLRFSDAQNMCLLFFSCNKNINCLLWSCNFCSICDALILLCIIFFRCLFFMWWIWSFQWAVSWNSDHLLHCFDCHSCSEGLSVFASFRHWIWSFACIRKTPFEEVMGNVCSFPFFTGFCLWSHCSGIQDKLQSTKKALASPCGPRISMLHSVFVSITFSQHLVHVHDFS